MAKLAKGLADNNPEFRPEYEEIAGQCSELPVQLLTQCQSTDEVKTILAESACSSKLFRYAGRMKYPRYLLKFGYSEKATKFFKKFGLLRISELYKQEMEDNFI